MKTIAVESGNYDDFPGEVDVRGSVTQQWATHLRRIMANIGIED